VHSLDPLTEDDDPAGQLTQIKPLVELLYLPAPQTSHPSPTVFGCVPTPHRTHSPLLL
jgi:hypothetical protein